MIKKYSFCDEMEHTIMVLDGRKWHIILPAPADPGCRDRVIMDDKLVFVDYFDKVIGSHKLPLRKDQIYRITRPYRDLVNDKSHGDIEVNWEYSKKDYAWRDKRAVPIKYLKDAFGIYYLKYKQFEDVHEWEWLANGIIKDDDGNYVIPGKYPEKNPSLEQVSALMMIRQFGYVPKYVYVYDITLTRIEDGSETQVKESL